MHIKEIKIMLPMLNSGSFYLNNEYLTDTLPDISFPDDEIPNYVKSFSLSNPKSATFELEADLDLLVRNIDATLVPSCTVELTEHYQVRRRKHKKKRINKKWAKRYGYETKFRGVRIKDVSLVNRYDNEFTVTGRDVELFTR
jgi:hypothetical protein